MRSLASRAVVYGLIIVLGLLAAAPNLLPHATLERLPDWYRSSTVALGLDLRGGSHLLLEVDSSELLLARYQQLADDLGATLRRDGVPDSRVTVSGDGVLMESRRPDEAEILARQMRAAIPETSSGRPQFTVRHEGTRIAIQIDWHYREVLLNDVLERSLDVVRRRLNESGLVEPSITRQGQDGILVQMPGVADPGQIRSLLGTTAKMSFHWVAEQDARSPGLLMTLPAQQSGQYTLERRVALEGKHIQDARLGFSQQTSEPVVTFVLDKEGGRRFGEITRDNVGRPLAIVLDGKVITAPVIRDVISGGRGEISGSFTTREATDLALLLRAGALPAPLNVIEERTVGPDLGSDAIQMGIVTGLLGAVLVIVFMLAVYGRWGLIACSALVINVGLIFGALSMFGATLTLPGIAGIILSIGMAVDANILINERIREELRKGKSAITALHQGFDRAYATILDSNLTTLIAVSLLFMFGSGPVKGFAVTIGIGLMTSMFTAISITRLVMEWRVRSRPQQLLNISGIALLDGLSVRGINFMRGRYIGLTASLILSLASLALFVHPGLKYGIDFTGGTVVEVRAPETTVDAMRTTLQQHGLANAAIQEFGQQGQYLVRLPMMDAAEVASGDTVQSLKAAVLEVAEEAEFPRVEMVGPKVSGNFAHASILAIALAGAGMLAYLWFRFEYHFALAATLTIVLDITKTVGFFVLAGIEFNLTAVAALLALIGYSINDKVVVFDRVRENLRLTPDKPLLALLNDSISSTLTRTVFTSVTTFLALLPMGIAGGSAVTSFALPMLFGIVIGTSSSVLIASPILFYLGQRRIQKGLAQLRPTADEMQKELDLIP